LNRLDWWKDKATLHSRVTERSENPEMPVTSPKRRVIVADSSLNIFSLEHNTLVAYHKGIL
jgi:hypothetical protein